MTRHHLPAVVFALLFAAACSESEAATPAPAPPAKTHHSNIRSIPVPAGTKLSCDRLLPADTLTEHLSRAVEVAEASRGEGNATCSVKLGGDLPKSRSAQRKLAKQNAGLLPGDEICQVTVECSFILDSDSEEEHCAVLDGKLDHDIGAVGCLRSFRDGQRYAYSSLDYDTGCRYEVVAGGKLSGEEAIPAIRECAQAAVDTISKDDLAPAIASR
jgi:hypothetical protein